MKRKVIILSLLGIAIAAVCPLVSLAVSPAQPDQNEPPAFTPKPLLELYDQKTQIDKEILDLWSKIEPLKESAVSPGRKGPGPLGVLDWRRQQGRKLGAHAKVQEIQNLQKKRANIVAKAWEIFRDLPNERKQGATEALTAAEKTELRKWMRESFGRPVPQRQTGVVEVDNPPFEGRIEMLRGQLQRGAKKIQELENRVQSLEDTVESQRREIAHLRARLQAIESKL